MTTTVPARAPDVPDGAPPDRSVPLLVLAGVVVLAVVGAVLVFGVQRPPALGTLADSPGPVPDAGIAFLVDRPDGSCVEVVWPDGATAGPWCDPRGGELVGWDDQGLLVRSWDVAETVRILDPATGEVVGRTRDLRSRQPERRPAVWTEHRDGELVVRLEEDDTEVWRVEATDRYDIRASSTSPDGDWVALIDSADRLAVVPADGSAPPRLWRTEVSSWQWPVWEGTPLDAR
jgi:hypothetical protein